MDLFTYLTKMYSTYYFTLKSINWLDGIRRATYYED